MVIEEHEAVYLTKKFQTKYAELVPDCPSLCATDIMVAVFKSLILDEIIYVC